MASIKGGEKLEARLKAMDDLATNAKAVQVGFLSRATYPDGTPVAMIAAIQDGGAPSRGIPPRPFFRNMIADKKGEWPGAIAALMKTNNYDAFRVLQLTGEAVAGQLRQSIVDTNAPPLADSTIARKGHSKPLVDSGLMLGSVDYEVKT